MDQEQRGVVLRHQWQPLPSPMLESFPSFFPFWTQPWGTGFHNDPTIPGGIRTSSAGFLTQHGRLEAQSSVLQTRLSVSRAEGHELSYLWMEGILNDVKKLYTCETWDAESILLVMVTVSWTLPMYQTLLMTVRYMFHADYVLSVLCLLFILYRNSKW